MRNRVRTAALFATAASLLPVFSIAQAQEKAGAVELDTVIVTAEKRSGDVQRLAAQINVVGGEALAGTTQVQDLQTLVPGIAMTQTGPFTQFNIRGVGAVVTSAYNDNAIAFNVDEIYLARPTGSHGTFFDIDRVEVLKGPQGTLYGRNATAGAINVVTNQPKFDNSFGGGVSYGNYNAVVANGFVNTYAGNTAFRLAGQIAKHDGYFDDGYDDEDSKAVRFQVKSNLTEKLTVSLGADYATQDGKNVGLTLYPYRSSDPWAIGPSSPISQAATPNIQNYGAFGGVDIENGGLRAAADWDMDWATWTTIGAYRRSDIKGTTYVGGIAITTDSEAKQWSFETRLASSTTDEDRFTWLVGLYYFKEEQNGFTTVNFGDAAVPSPPAFFPVPAGSLLRPNSGFTSVNDPTTDTSYAIFTQETFRILPKLKLTGGLRYFVEKKENEGVNTFYTSNFVPVPPLVIPATGELEWKKTNYKIGLDYELADNSLIYASVGNGWHAGGFLRGAEPGPGNPNTLPNSYEPETLTAYTIGTKNRFLDNRLQVNAEIFYWDYDNRQYTALAPINTGAPPTGFPVIDSRSVNVGKSHLQGASVDVLFQAAANTRLSATVEYMDEAKNDRNVYNVATVLGVPIGCRPLSVSLPYGYTTVDCSGSKIPFVSKWSATLGLTQRFPLSEDRAIVLDINSKLETSQLVGVNGSPLQVRGGYTRTNASLTYETEHYNVSAFVKNIEDEAVRSTTGPSYSAFDPNPPFVAQLQSPRTYGVEVSFRY
jgi:iron complex outermembrane receptor protein